MSIQLRAWLMLTVVLVAVQTMVALLTVLQHDAVFSGLMRQRLAVLAQTTGQVFQPVVDLGLPLSMMRNGNAIAGRPLELDQAIRGVDVFAPSGVVVHTSRLEHPPSVPDQILATMRLAKGPAWSVEEADALNSGYTIFDRDGLPVGAVVVSYPKATMGAASRAMRWQMASFAMPITVVFSTLAYLMVHFMLAAPQRALGRLEQRFEADPHGLVEPFSCGADSATERERGLFAAAINELEAKLAVATSRFVECRQQIGRVASGAALPAAPDRDTPAARPARATGSLAAEAARRLALPTGLLIVVAAVLLGALALGAVNRSIEPELAARTSLIGSIVSESVERAVNAGVPLENLAGAETYFEVMLERLPEVAYVAVATGRILFEVGNRIDPYLAPPRERKEVRSHPILLGGEEIAYVVIDINPAFVASQFRNVFLDMGVIVLVTIFLAFEVMVLLTSRSLTAGLDHLQRLAAMQAAGDFSRSVALGARDVAGPIARGLGNRAQLLHAEFMTALQQAGPHKAVLLALRERLGVGEAGPTLLRLSYFTDIRLALFLFAAADQLPLSFLPLYTWAAANPWKWLDSNVVISLPLAGYLIAILIASPLSRSWTERLGHRRLLLLAAVPTAIAHLGLFFATSVPEIVLWRTVTGFGYAIVSLACQDYVIDNVPKDQRDRSLGMFSAVLFGGIFCGTALGGVLADRLGAANVFLVSVALIAVSALLVARLLQPASPSAPAIASRITLPPLGAALKSRHFAVLVLGIALPANLVLQAFISYIVPVALDAMRASTADIGRMLMLYFLAIAAVGPVAGRAAGVGLTVSQAALGGALFSGATITLAAAWPGQISMACAVLGAGVGHGLVRGAGVSLAMTIAENELAHLGPTATLGALRTLERGGSVVGLMVVATVAGSFGYPVATAALAVTVLMGAGLFAMVEWRGALSRGAT